MAVLTGLLSVAETTINPPGGIPWEWLILKVFDFIADYGWRILLFTVLLKLLLYPLDLFQRYKMRKNQKITERLKPEMDRLQKACGGNTQEFQQKQMQLNKREGYSYFSACLPALLTMVIFIWLFTSLNNISQYMILKQYVEWYDVYDPVYSQVLVDEKYDSIVVDPDSTPEEQEAAQSERKRIRELAIDRGATAVYEFYNGENSNKETFLWIKNIWSPDVPWKKPILDESGFKSAIGKWGTNAKKLGFDEEQWKEFEKVLEQYSNVTLKLQKDPDNKTNGILVLPILAAGLSFLSQFISQRQQKKSGQANPAGGGGMMKAMMFIFPIMMIFFSLTYTAAFTLYIVLNSGMTVLLNLLSTGIFAIKDRHGEKVAANTIIKYGRPDPNDIIKKK